MRDFMITSSFLTGVVLLIRYLAKGRLNPMLQYALWIPVVLRLIIPVPLWSSQFSVLNLVPDSLPEHGTAFSGEIISDTPSGEEKHTENTAGNGAAQEGWTSLLMPGDNAPEEIQAQPQPRHENAAGQKFSLTLEGVLLFLWFLGMLSAGSYMLFYQIKWKKYLRANRKPLAGREIYRKHLPVYTVKNLPSPCLSGNCIYLTPEMAKDPKRLEHILIHEYCHYRHLDFLWVMVRCVLIVVYWFHPLVWAAARASKQDSELACDAAAIRMLGEQERLAYGKTLLLLIAGDGYDWRRMGIASTMSGGEKGIRARIVQIAAKPKYMAATAGIILLLIAAAGFAAFSGASKEKGVETESVEADRQKEPAPAESADGQREEQRFPEGQKNPEQLQALEQEMEQARQQQQETEQQVQRLEQEMEEEVKRNAVLKELASYDSKIEETGSRPGVYAVRDAMNRSDYVQDYYEKGEAALEEGMYLLAVHKGSDSSDIKIYGMYSEEYGCEGIKILIGDDVNDFDVEWSLSYLGNIRLYESAEDGMPRTFVWQMLAENTSDAEVWDLYLCDRLDTGTIEQHTIQAEALLEELGKRLRFEIHAEECRIDVYDKDNKVGSIPVDASPETMESVQEVIVDDSVVAWELGSSEDEIRMMPAVGLKLNGTDEIWYYRLPLLSIPVTCGTFGERTFQFGQASVDTRYMSNKGRLDMESLEEFLELTEEPAPAQSSGTELRQDGIDVLSTAFTDNGAHYDVEIRYINPCPSYTRISDSFGTRTNPATGEKQLHGGIDLAAEKGADIVAAAEGTVYQTGFDSDYGNYIVLYHVLSGEFTYYAGCQDVLAAEGENVAAGQKIATVGSTGRSTGPHLHFALSRNGEYVEPTLESLE